jgi:hypothetical protein
MSVTSQVRVCPISNSPAGPMQIFMELKSCLHDENLVSNGLDNFMNYTVPKDMIISRKFGSGRYFEVAFRHFPWQPFSEPPVCKDDALNITQPVSASTWTLRSNSESCHLVTTYITLQSHSTMTTIRTALKVSCTTFR